MANLYEIDTQITECFDADTGELLDAEKLENLMIEKENKLENVALWIKNLKADAAMYKAEKTAFAERQAAAERKAESLTEWLKKRFERSEIQDRESRGKL